MKRKDCLAILGLLHSSIGRDVYYEGKHPNKIGTVETLSEHDELGENILDYLKSLKLSYAFVRDILANDYGSVFYHKELGPNSILLPKGKKLIKENLYTSDHDNQIWVDDNGRLGVWCEVDGFVAWLDEYKKVWIVDSRKEVKRRREEYNKWFEENFGKHIRSSIEKAFDGVWKETDPDELLKSGVVKIKPFKMNGIEFYRANKEKDEDE